LLDLDIGLPMDRLGEYVRASLEDGAAEREVVLDATNRRGRAFRCRVGSAPHRDADGRRLGLILLMEEEGGAV
jgi:two-component system CheB/CheR fusion protein